ncbi:cysteine desulfurase family protein [Phragmitibacter flavus]|uniref:cysteine desulfurase family protein n=1 Tax=Phragmitibacter flavus TaxID=2576071 RepID=UPI00140CD993|nr:aminotransferase class V-fold PLP-dependent enzyme [Phragmitibacter flavus]
MPYLDSNATTQVDPEVFEAMLPFLKEQYANPSASYRQARQVRKAIDIARQQVAALIDAEPEEIIFTSGGTEANNAAVFSALTLHYPNKTHLVTAKTEHSAVLEPAKRWMMEGQPVSFLNVSDDGQVNLNELGHCIIPNQTALLSIMWANNETGVIGPIAQAAGFAHENGALFHTDAVQAIGKVPVSVKKLPIDYLALSGHKFHAPKGIGALYVSKRVRFKPWMLGGGQENGRRSGTENVPFIIALGKAAELAMNHLSQGTSAAIATLRDTFEQTLLNAIPGSRVHGASAIRLGTTSNLYFPNIDAAGLLIMLDAKNIACSGGSACHTAQLHPSHVLEAMGVSAEDAQRSIRFSFSRFNTQDEVALGTQTVIECVKKMQELKGDNLVVQSTP